MEGRRYDVVRIGLRHEIVSISWSSREALLDQFRNLDSMNEIRDAFRAVGTSRPVQLTGHQEAELLNAITAWASQTDGGYDDLPDGIFQLRNALHDDVYDASVEAAQADAQAIVEGDAITDTLLFTLAEIHAHAECAAPIRAHVAIGRVSGSC